VRNLTYIEVLINKRLFTYQSAEEVQVGQEVLVPLRQRRASGYVVKIVPQPAFETKAIVDVVRVAPQFTNDLAELAEWIAEYYRCYRSKALELILPKG